MEWQVNQHRNNCIDIQTKHLRPEIGLYRDTATNADEEKKCNRDEEKTEQTTASYRDGIKETKMKTEIMIQKHVRVPPGRQSQAFCMERMKENWKLKS